MNQPQKSIAFIAAVVCIVALLAIVSFVAIFKSADLALAIVGISDSGEVAQSPQRLPESASSAPDWLDNRAKENSRGQQTQADSSSALFTVLASPNSPAAQPTEVKGGSNSKRPILAYDWKPDTFYQWRFDIKSSADSTKKKYSGISSFTARKKKSPDSSEKQSGTGTAFVVNEAGWLVTCAHVVDNSTTVRVRLGEKEFPAEVVGSDASNDLALLKINANNLQPLPLATSDGVDLGQEIRCVGFPLTDLLGKSVKVTRGAVSGKVRLNDRDLYQVDAAINPGNSGGPVVDARGNVVGVASQKISGERVSNIGFCIPSRTLSQFLKDSKVSVSDPIAKADVDGPTLARQVIPSVALVEVEIGAQNQYELTDYSEFDRGSDSLFEMPSQRSLRMGRSRVVIDANGTLVDSQSIDSPLMLGPLATLGVIRLPRPWQSTWGESVEFRLTLVIEEEDPFQALMRNRYGRLRRPLDSQLRTIAINCEQHDRYKILETTGDLVKIEREFILASTSEPKFEQRVNWIYQFDTRAALVTKAHATGGLRIGDKLATSMEIDITNLKTDIAANSGDIQKNSSSAGSNAPMKPAETMPPEVVAALAKLSDAKSSAEDRIVQLNQLAKIQWSVKFRQKVVDQIAVELKGKDEAVVLAAIKALTNWDAASCVDEVVKLLNHKSPAIRGAAVEYLGSMQDGAAAIPLVEALADINLREAIYAALRSIGPTAEVGAIKMLSHSEESVRLNACSVLEEIGSQRCAAELRRIAKGSGQDAAQATKTLTKLGFSRTVDQSQEPDISDENPFEPKKKK
ncbi:MAG: trypsin-like peptidase domain-containing protein [Pirellulales bacterium]